MAHKKYILIKDFESQKIGGSIIISENQVDYFVENGFIDGEKKKTKTKTKVATVLSTEAFKESNNIIKE